MKDEAAPRPDPLAPLIEALHEEGRPRVWSLVVTVFGDAVAPRGGRVATGALAELLGRVGVGEGALRTALSRLVADGTLRRDRQGRASFHRLSAAAARETAEASRVIYAAPADAEGWVMGVGPPPPRALPLPGGAWLSREAPPEAAVAVRGALLGAAGVEPEPAHAEALARLARDLDALEALLGAAPVVEREGGARTGGGGAKGDGAGGSAPPGGGASPAGGESGRALASGWEAPTRAGGNEAHAQRLGGAGRARERRGEPGAASGEPVGGPEAQAAGGAGMGAPPVPGSRAVSLRADPGGCAPADLAPLDAMAARVLLVHRWRRLALRWPDLPEAVPGSGARRGVAAAYRALRPASEAWLDAALPPANGPSQEAPGFLRVEDRFG